MDEATRSAVTQCLRYYGKFLDTVLARGCQKLLNDWEPTATPWDPVEPSAPNSDYLQQEMRRREVLTNACAENIKVGKAVSVDYDTPALGIFHTLTYHLFHTRILIETLAPWISALGDRLTIHDFGSGTGPTAWAVATIAAAFDRTGIRRPDLKVVSLDQSEEMNHTSEMLLSELMDELAPDIESPFEAFPPLQCDWKNYATNGDDSERVLVVGSYIWSASDVKDPQSAYNELANALGKCAADHLLIIGPKRKINDMEKNARKQLTSLQEQLTLGSPAGWDVWNLDPLPRLWLDKQSSVNSLFRKTVNSLGIDGPGRVPYVIWHPETEGQHKHCLHRYRVDGFVRESWF